MFWLKKIFHMRDSGNPESEKSFLDHVEDLRRMLFKMALVLFVTVTLSFVFQQKLMDVLLVPAREVQEMFVDRHLPRQWKVGRGMSGESWRAAVKAERGLTSLAGRDREIFLEYLGKAPELAFQVEAIALLRAVDAMPVEAREGYLKAAAASEEMRTYVEELRRAGGVELVEHPVEMKFSALKPTEAFMLSMHLSFCAGVVLGLPFLLYFLLEFVLPGLHRHETRVILPALGWSILLFLGGVAFAYFWILPKGLEFLFNWGNDMGVKNDWRIGDYIGFSSQFLMLTGVAFQLPVVVMILVKLDILGYESMKNSRRYAFFGIAALATIITPTGDPMTMGLMALPMVLLYELCIWLAFLHERKKQREENEQRLRVRALPAQEEE